MRSAVLRIRLSSNFSLYNVWDRARYDDEDRLFFVNTDVNCDVGVLRLCMESRVEIRGRTVDVKLEFMCYALGWTSALDDVNPFQYTLLDYDIHEPAITKVQSQISSWDYDTDEVFTMLIRQKIPRNPAVMIKIQNTDYTAVVTAKPTCSKDRNLCTGPVWDLTFACVVYQDIDVPQMESNQWRMPIYE
ncbi:HET protein [Apiospora kogelbergensis]|uniref:HET protein n=1 Tax=Apiospora kogelbergensis TaxID=1337665 RepID=UPI00312DCADB